MSDEMNQPPVRRTPDFISRHANNVRFENYGTDLKIVFGESDMASGSEVFEQHTAITMSWQQAKLFSYFLQTQLIAYETQMGAPIQIHPVSIPPDVPKEVETSDLPHAKEVTKAFRTLRQRMFFQ
jgi:hypothetical protein